MLVEPKYAVLLDRSRDGLRSAVLLPLWRDRRFQVTENERRLSATVLARYDVLVIQACASAHYTAAELKAVRQFVRAGGGLLLSTSPGQFELDAGAPVSTSAAQQIAGLFGVRFLSPADARGRVTWSDRLDRGFRSGELALSTSGPLRGTHSGDLILTRSAPLALPRGARWLLRHRRTREPVAARLTYGRGRIVVGASATFGEPWDTIGRQLAQWLAGAGKATPRPLPARRTSRLRRFRRGEILLSARGVSARRANELAALVVDIVGNVKKTLQPKHRAQWSVEILPGTGCRLDRDWRTDRAAMQVGAGTSRPSLVYGIALAACERILQAAPLSNLMWRCIDPWTLARHLALRMMDAYGFEREASKRRAILEAWPDGRGDPRRVDLGWWRHEAGTSPAMWIWPELEKAFGPDLIRRLFRCVPKTFPWKKFPHWDVFTELDIVIYYLSLAAKRDVFQWFAERGTTVHPLPRVSTKDKSFERRCLTAVRRQMRDTSRPIGERFDAARVLMRSRIKQRVSLNREARRLTSQNAADRLISAMRLARTRDPRGAPALRRIAQHSTDTAYAAIAAIALSETGDPAAADRLTELAGQADARFQLDARTALRRLGRDLHAPLRVVARRQDPFERHSPLKYLAMVDGCTAANVFSGPDTEHWPQGLLIPRHYVQWVHTAPKWRRKGISRTLLFATVNDPWARRVPICSLDTGTSNVAHTLYRDAGFIDTWVWSDWSRDLAQPVPAPRVKGVRIRPATDRDVAKMAALHAEVHADYCQTPPVRPTPLAPHHLAVIAEQKGALIGWARGVLQPPNDKGTVRSRLTALCVKSGKTARQVTTALLARYCRTARRKGAASVKTWHVPDDEDLRRGFESAGFDAKRDGGVEMWRLNDLPMLLGHLRPLLEHRLLAKKRADWTGTIALCGQRHRAGLRLRGGKVAVLKTPPSRADIQIETDDDTLSRIVVGLETVFEAMLQARLRIHPKANRDVTTLLEALLPKMKRCPPG